MKLAVVLVVVCALLLGGCAGMSHTEQRVLSGGALGASSGALVGGPRVHPQLAPQWAGLRVWRAVTSMTAMKRVEAALKKILHRAGWS